MRSSPEFYAAVLTLSPLLILAVSIQSRVTPLDVPKRLVNEAARLAERTVQLGKDIREQEAQLNRSLASIESDDPTPDVQREIRHLRGEFTPLNRNYRRVARQASRLRRLARYFYYVLRVWVTVGVAAGLVSTASAFAALRDGRASQLANVSTIVALVGLLVPIAVTTLLPFWLKEREGSTKGQHEGTKLTETGAPTDLPEIDG